ncbi:MAG: tetratricopeptide repeat protein [Alphaproteobacteria bacterium]
MSDNGRPSDDGLIRQVDEEVRRDRMTTLMRRYGPMAVVAAVIVVVVAASVVGWRAWQTSQRIEAGNAYAQALGLIGAGRLDEAAQAMQDIAAAAPAGYAALARLQGAAVRAEAGDPGAASALFAAVADDRAADPQLRQFAALMVAQHGFDQLPDDVLRARLDPLAADDSIWRFSARELLAHMALRQGDSARGRDLLAALASDPASPDGVRARARDMLSALGGPQ